MKKILFLYRYGILGGVCTQLFHRLKNIPEEIEVHCGFISKQGAENLLRGKCKLHFSLDPSDLESLIVSEDIDIVIVIDTEEYLTEMINLDRSVNKILEVHTSIKRNLTYLERIPENFHPSVITVSEYMRDLISEIKPSIESEEIIVIPNIVDSKEFPNMNIQESNEDPPLVWIGKIDDHKNWKLAFEICSDLTQREFKFCLWVVGGHTANSRVAEEFLQTANEMGILERIKWIDKIDHNEMSDLLHSAKCRGGLGFVTSKAESFGMSILESLLVGLPVISANTGAISEITENRQVLQLYEINQPKTASARISKLLGKWHMNEKYVKSVNSESTKMRNRYDSAKIGLNYWEQILNLAKSDF